MIHKFVPFISENICIYFVVTGPYPPPPPGANNVSQVNMWRLGNPGATPLGNPGAMPLGNPSAMSEARRNRVTTNEGKHITI